LKFTVLQPEPADVGGLQVPRGALTGFVDLMIRRNGRYFVLDFKTNDVGADAASYAPVTLLEDVRSNGYDVQGLMYARALLKRLRLSEPATSASHIGGALVVYLRGLDANSPGQGVVHLRFKEQDLND
jgi:exodeoxyribonuclease V beta subunit